MQRVRQPGIGRDAWLLIRPSDFPLAPMDGANPALRNRAVDVAYCRAPPPACTSVICLGYSPQSADARIALLLVSGILAVERTFRYITIAPAYLLPLSKL